MSENEIIEAQKEIFAQFGSDILEKLQKTKENFTTKRKNRPKVCCIM